MTWLKAIIRIVTFPFILVFGILCLFLTAIYQIGGGDIKKHWLSKFVRYE
jgi:hypothetical protein